jgi:hypothetical protein
MENINKIGEDSEQFKVFINPNDIEQGEPKTKEQLQKELEEKIKTFVEKEQKRNVFGY